MNKNFDEARGTISSLKNNFPPSARGCKMPNGPARLGPLRSCRHAAIFLSAYVVYMATISERVTTKPTNKNFSKMYHQSIAKKCIIYFIQYFGILNWEIGIEISKFPITLFP